jgi:glycine/D-amino acid oxidase-like deaminating enzyme
MSENWDAVIVGGAVMGASTAYHLTADPGFGGRVLVVERDQTYQRAASALSASGIRQQFSTAINIRVSLHGIAFMRAAQDVLAVGGERPGIGLLEGGYLYLASPAGLPVLEQNHALQVREGADIALLDRAGLARRFPYLTLEGIIGGCVGLTGEGWFDGYSLMQAFRRKARAQGATWREGEVLAFERAGGRVTGVLLADGSRIGCGAVVLTAGASGARALALALGLDIPVYAKKRCVFAFNARDRIAAPPLTIDPSGVWWRPEGENFICGVSPDDLDTRDHGADFEVDWPLFEETIWPALAARVAAFETIRPGRAWAGHYDMNLFDHNAIVGRVPGLSNVFLAAGFSGHGIQQSPAVGRGLAELVTHDAYRTLDLSPFAFERIIEGRPILERNVI